MSLAERAQAEELMDADDLDAATYAAVVGDLAQVNTVTLAARPTLAFLDARRRGRRRDSGCSTSASATATCSAASRAGRRGAGSPAELVGVDLNPRSELAARAHTPAGPADPLRHRRLCRPGRRRLGLRRLQPGRASHDPRRSSSPSCASWTREARAAGWSTTSTATALRIAAFRSSRRLARWHPIVRHDGTLSIARSYRPAEWPPILAEAGVADARVFRAFPFRLCVESLRLRADRRRRPGRGGGRDRARRARRLPQLLSSARARPATRCAAAS